MKRQYRDKATTKKRLGITLVILYFVIFILAFRLSYIMIFKSEKYAAMAVEQWTSEVKIAAKRGKILDRNEKELAVSANVYRVDFNLNAIRSYNEKNNTTNEQLSNLIAEATEMDKETVLKKLEFKLPSGALAGSAILVRRIEKEHADKVKALNIDGVIVSPDTKRYYTNDNFLAHVLGTTNSDGVGLNGVELKYDKVLSGTPGLRTTELATNIQDHPYTISQFTAPVNGKDLLLTIDENMQYFAEKTADIALKEHNADAVTVMVMDPTNGEVLALSNKPDFNPNAPYDGAENFQGNTSTDRIQKMWRNRSVSDSFEPGSIFKIVTAAAAIEEGLAGKDETYTCSGGLHKADRYIKCWKRSGHGTQTFDEIIQNSCNVGFMNLGERLGKEKLNKYIKEFGFGKKSGVDLPGESPGIIKKTQNITDMDLATISFGQTNTVNPIQFLSAVNAVANKGTWIQPHVVKEIIHIDENGNKIVDEEFKPDKKENIISKETAERLNSALEKAVHYGSSKSTYMEGYGIAGKTGTAQKVNPETGGYGGGYVASFVGFAPYDNPKVSVMISVDNPKNGEYYGGRVAAPLANILFTDIFNYLDPNKLNVSKPNENMDVVVPEVREKSVDEAKKILKDLNIEVLIEGQGNKILDMTPKPGYTIKEKTNIILYTEKSEILSMSITEAVEILNEFNLNEFNLEPIINGSGNKVEGIEFENNEKKEEFNIVINTEEKDKKTKKEVIVPNLVGYTELEAKNILDSIGLKGTFSGSGIVNDQNIESGIIINSGSNITLNLSNLPK
ncbi:stage V sporulation protein D [Clostridium tarantellae]|uniref:stage V sporulation protein D n=1 Tax=Clostridium tarantellae TaxID=39493 RepID=UPI0014784216|nr:stage V sporulation protein D [Clostridium tarantellae]